jgi:hypothetical protein
LGIDQLGVDPDLVARPPDTPFQHVAHVQLAADLLCFYRSALIGEGSTPGDDETPHHARQIGRQVVGDAVREIFLVRIVIEVGKRHDDDRQVRWRAGNLAQRATIPAPVDDEVSQKESGCGGERDNATELVEAARIRDVCSVALSSGLPWD